MKQPTRREIFGLAGSAAALLAAGRLPVLAATPAIPPEATPVEGYISANAPAPGHKSPSRLSYTVLRWTDSDPASGKTKNIEIGRLDIETSRENGGVKLTVRQRTSYPRPVNRLEAEALCRDDVFYSLKSWKVKSWIEDRDDCEYEASGKLDGTSVRIDDGLGERSFAAEGPLASLWSLPAALSAGKAQAGSFHLVEDFLLSKPKQTLRASEPLRVPYQDGTHVLRSWSQVGPGVLPIHYLVDEAGLPQLMTQGALAWALREAS